MVKRNWKEEYDRLAKAVHQLFNVASTNVPEERSVRVLLYGEPSDGTADRR